MGRLRQPRLDSGGVLVEPDGAIFHGHAMPPPSRTSATKAILCLIALAFAAYTPPAQASSSRASMQDAQAMVKDAIEALDKRGEEKTYKEISKFDGRFADRDLYLVVVDLDGNCLASGSRIYPTGQNLLESGDANGQSVIGERIAIAKSKSSFWQSYKYLDPLTRRVFAKRAYCQTWKKTVICGSVYETP